MDHADQVAVDHPCDIPEGLIDEWYDLPLLWAFSEAHEHDGLTQSELARRLGVELSRISRCLSGSNNLTLSSVAELAWAMGATISFGIKLDERAEASLAGARTMATKHRE